MSRPIKFRAWDKSSKRYGEVVEIEYNESREISEVWAWYNIHERYEPIPGANAIVEQYTGLKDKNGEDIYEGDIVRCWDACRGKVYFDEVLLQYCVKFNDGDYEDLASSEPEVIGNIHENPELVGGEEYGK